MTLFLAKTKSYRRTSTNYQYNWIMNTAATLKLSIKQDNDMDTVFLLLPVLYFDYSPLTVKVIAYTFYNTLLFQFCGITPNSLHRHI